MHSEKELKRYDRQMRFSLVGKAGQVKLSRARVIIVGCGALGTVIADQLVRGGVGSLLIIDRDIVELHNLQRQTLFCEADAGEKKPKAVAAEEALRKVNSQVEIKGLSVDLNFGNCLAHARDKDLIIDATDNFATRQLINDVALELGVPWIYGGAVGREGMAKLIIPGQTSCFRCLMAGIPGPGETPTCDTAGVIAPTTNIVASMQVVLAIKLLTGAEVDGSLYLLDTWSLSTRQLKVPRLEDCPACGEGKRDFLEGEGTGAATALCGREMVQVLPSEFGEIDLDDLAGKLQGLGKIENKKYYLAFNDGQLELSIFPDGRCLVKGTSDTSRARSTVNKYLGG